MNIYDANMFDSRNLNLRLFTNALKLDKQVMDSYKFEFQIITKNICITFEIDYKQVKMLLFVELN